MTGEALRNLRHALRGLAKSPGFSATVLLTLAFGIGATVAVFSVVSSVLLKPLPYPDADELVAIWHKAPGAPGVANGNGDLPLSPSMHFTFSEQSNVLASAGLWIRGEATVTGLAEPEQVPSLAVTAGVLETLRVPPLLGRWLDASDQERNGPPRALLDYDYWQTRFGGDPKVIGRNITVNAVPTEIVGVMPRGFRIVDTAADLIMPARFPREMAAQGPPFCCNGIGRLKPGATLEQANVDAARLDEIWFDTVGGGRAFFQPVWRIAPALRPLKQEVIGGVGSVLWVVLGTVGVVLLIACANVTNLLLVRTEGRERELAVRAALGAGAWRVARLLLLESVALAVAGGALGVVLAYGAVEVIKRLGPTTLPRISEIGVDGQSLALGVAASLLAGLTLGAMPSLKFAGPRIVAGLHGGARGSSGSRRQHRAQNVLVVGQVALALVLLVSSGLMIRTFQSLLTVDPGVAEPATLQTVRLAIPPSLEPDADRTLRMQKDIVDAFAALPGVSSAAFVSAMPLEGIAPDWDVVQVEGAPSFANASESPIRRFKYTSAGLLETAGTKLVAGRDLSWDDLYRNVPVAMVSENFARELWGSADAALGHRIIPARAPDTAPNWRTIVGVVQDVQDNALDQPAPTIVYWPSMMRGFYGFAPVTIERSPTFVLRTPRAGTPALIAEMQRAVWSVNPDLPLASVRTMKDVYDASLARTSFTLVMLALAAAVALVLGVVGLYGVLSYTVAQRRREIAIRLALGAQQSAVTRSFVGYGLVLASIGVVLGLGAAAAVARLMESLLFGVQPLDVATYAAVAALLTAVALIASWLPARRAAGVDPAEALAAE